MVLQADEAVGPAVPSGVTLEGSAGTVIWGPGRINTDKASCLMRGGGTVNCAGAMGLADFSVGVRAESPTSVISLRRACN